MKEKVFFAHANGFPSEVYKDLLKRLPEFDITIFLNWAMEAIKYQAHGKILCPKS